MSRPVRVLLISSAAAAVAALAAACGSEKVSVPRNDPTHAGAVLFSQRCAGCHTLSYAGTHGSAANVRTAAVTNGPNFNVRCERPLTRVLYAIQNGGFSGAIMPQNVVVGQEAIEVAQFVAKYAGRQAPRTTGQVPCESRPIGTIPPPTATTASSASPAKAASNTTPSTASKAGGGKKGGQATNKK